MKVVDCSAIIDALTHAERGARLRATLDDELFSPDLLVSEVLAFARRKQLDKRLTAAQADSLRRQRTETQAKLLKAANAAEYQLVSGTSLKVGDIVLVEAGDTMPFEIYRQQYISPDRLGLGTTAVAPALAAA